MTQSGESASCFDTIKLTVFVMLEVQQLLPASCLGITASVLVVAAHLSESYRAASECQA
jgi:hypothetical protein